MKQLKELKKNRENKMRYLLPLFAVLMLTGCMNKYTVKTDNIQLVASDTDSNGIWITKTTTTKKAYRTKKCGKTYYKCAYKQVYETHVESVLMYCHRELGTKPQCISARYHRLKRKK